METKINVVIKHLRIRWFSTKNLPYSPENRALAKNPVQLAGTRRVREPVTVFHCRLRLYIRYRYGTCQEPGFRICIHFLRIRIRGFENEFGSGYGSGNVPFRQSCMKLECTVRYRNIHISNRYIRATHNPRSFGSYRR